MPTKRKRMIHAWQEPVHPAVLRYLETGVLPSANEDFWIVYSLTSPHDDTDLRATWDAVKDELLSAYTATHPGRRPWAWWVYDAPEPRSRVGGTGDVFSSGKLHYGLETDWTHQWQVDLYNGRTKLAEGLHVPEWREGAFTKRAIDANDPPTFESEASFLRRHHLFASGEERRLTPADFEPVALTFAVGDGDDEAA